VHWDTTMVTFFLIAYLLIGVAQIWAGIEGMQLYFGIGGFLSVILLFVAYAIPLVGTIGVAKKLDPYRETARIVLEPWLVEAALARLPQKLSPADQRIVVKATRTPRKVRWPEWWSENP
jgi:hypothetical protein